MATTRPRSSIGVGFLKICYFPLKKMSPKYAKIYLGILANGTTSETWKLNKWITLIWTTYWEWWTILDITQNQENLKDEKNCHHFPFVSFRRSIWRNLAHDLMNHERSHGSINTTLHFISIFLSFQKEKRKKGRPFLEGVKGLNVDPSPILKLCERILK